MERSPLAPPTFPAMTLLAGVTLATAASGMKYQGRDDMLLMQFCEGTTLAGIFTKSATASAAVLSSREIVAGGYIRALLVNAGNANAFTGQVGDEAVATLTSALATKLHVPETQIATSSTGVIGEPLDTSCLILQFEALTTASTASWEEAANAIRTTDTFAKGASATCDIAGKTVTISGIAKGSGMIAPDMATMLAFIVTDAAINPAALQQACAAAGELSFNAITVDSDTSTSDSVYLAATGQNVAVTSDADLAIFCQTLQTVMQDLAIQIVRDGEGASKLITIDVTGAVSDASAHRIGLAIGNSPLVKTAIAGEDANWGRIVMAVGKAGEPADRDKLDIAIGGHHITERGQRRADYDEAPVAAHMTSDEIHIAVDIGLGTGTARIWTCDLTHGYITINADYRS